MIKVSQVKKDTKRLVTLNMETGKNAIGASHVYGLVRNPLLSLAFKNEKVHIVSAMRAITVKGTVCETSPCETFTIKI